MRKHRIYRFIVINGKSYRMHRLIMAAYLGRKLTSDEVVHHIDDDGTNNDLENLQLMSRQEHNLHSGRESVKVHAKLQAEDIPNIRRMLRDKIRHSLIAWIYQVDRTRITRINTGDSWAWV